MKMFIRTFVALLLPSALLVIGACQSTGSSTQTMTAEEHYEQGVKEFQKQNYSTAMNHYNRAIEQNETYHQAYNQRGLLQIHVGNPKGAIRDFSRALKIKDDFSTARFNRGLAYAKMGAYSNAVSDFSSVVELEPDNLKARFQRGKTRLLMGEPERAIDDFSRVLDEEFRYRVQVFQAIAYRAMDEPEKALEALNTAVEKAPEQPLAYSYRAALHGQLGNKQKAKKDMNKFRSLLEEENSNQ